MYPAPAQNKNCNLAKSMLRALVALLLFVAVALPGAGAYTEENLSALQAPLEHRDGYSIASVDNCLLIALYYTSSHPPFLFTIGKGKEKATTVMNKVVDKLNLRNHGEVQAFQGKNSAAFIPNDLYTYSLPFTLSTYSTNNRTSYVLRVLCSKTSKKPDLQFLGWQGTAVRIRSSFSVREPVKKSSGSYTYTTYEEATATFEISLDLAEPNVDYLTMRVVKGKPSSAFICFLFNWFTGRRFSSSSYEELSNSQKTRLRSKYYCQDILCDDDITVVSRVKQYRGGLSSKVEEYARHKVEDKPTFEPPASDEEDHKKPEEDKPKPDKQPTPKEPESNTDSAVKVEEVRRNYTPTEAMDLYLEFLRQI